MAIKDNVILLGKKEDMNTSTIQIGMYPIVPGCFFRLMTLKRKIL
jgi:hypothetical protein